MKAANFYRTALLISIGLVKNSHAPKKSELAFQKWAISNSKLAVQCGPRTDTEFSEMATAMGCDSILFEASPVFARVLAKKLRGNKRAKVVNLGISSKRGTLKYFYLNQSFVRNLGFPSLGLHVPVKVSTLDDYFCGKTKPDFIATDIEGLDIEAYLGGKEALKYARFFQLEMSSTNLDVYLNLFRDFTMYFLFDSDHPLWISAGMKSIIDVEELGWKRVFDSMRKGDTNVLVGVRKGLAAPHGLLENNYN